MQRVPVFLPLPDRTTFRAGGGDALQPSAQITVMPCTFPNK